MESLPPIDVFSEDDPLISASYNAVPDLPSSYTCTLEGEGAVKMSKQMERVPELSVSIAKVNKVSQVQLAQWFSLGMCIFFTSDTIDLCAWQNQFLLIVAMHNNLIIVLDLKYTYAGVLNPEELAILNCTFEKAEATSLPRIPEDIRKSAESTSIGALETLR